MCSSEPCGSFNITTHTRPEARAPGLRGIDAPFLVSADKFFLSFSEVPHAPARRMVLKRAAALGMLSAADSAVFARPFFLFSQLMPKVKKRSVLMLGGGWGGLTASRHERENAPDLEIV